MKDYIYFCVILLLQFIGAYCSSRKVYLDRHCGSTISLSRQPKGVLQLSLTPDDEYAPYTDCHVTVIANQDMRIGVTFVEMNIMSFETCQSDYLQIYDGVKITNSTFLFTTSQDHYQFCGQRLPPHLASVHSNVTFRFVSDGMFSANGFSVLLTAFHTGRCRGDEFQCGNSRCIHEDLYCDDLNHCGDGSDLCTFSVYVIVGVALSSVILVIALLVLGSVVRYRFRKRSPRDDELDFDGASIGTECTDFEQAAAPVAVGAIACPPYFPGISTNIISVITRSSVPDDGDVHAPNRNTAVTETCSPSGSFWLNNQLAF